MYNNLTILLYSGVFAHAVQGGSIPSQNSHHFLKGQFDIVFELKIHIVKISNGLKPISWIWIPMAKNVTGIILMDIILPIPKTTSKTFF